jgi:hypothetical protein
MMAADPGGRAFAEPRVFPLAFAFAVPAIVGVAAMLMLGPTIFAEGVRDWTAYRYAGQLLAAGAPIYVPSAGVYPLFNYPPAAAAIWSLGLTPAIWLLAKVVALIVLAAVIGWPLGIPAVVLLLMTPSLQHDLVLGNVMTFYCLALSWSALRPGRVGSSALGLLLAIAMKPVIGPYLLWLLLVRRSDFGWVVLTAGVASVIVAIVIGPANYVDYIVTLPRFASLAGQHRPRIYLAAARGGRCGGVVRGRDCRGSTPQPPARHRRAHVRPALLRGGIRAPAYSRGRAHL